MNILFIAPHYPFYDRASGDFRLLQILKSLVTAHKISFCGVALRSHTKRLGQSEISRYENELHTIGVEIIQGGPRDGLRKKKYDVIVFEFYYFVKQWLTECRIRQPQAKIIIDSVDVHFQRLTAKAELTQSHIDKKQAEIIMSEELKAYSSADLIVTVTSDDELLVKERLPTIRTAIISNIHTIHQPSKRPENKSLLFVGSFVHDPNIDAMIYFCKEVMPLILRKHPDVHLSIVGGNPPPQVSGLASDNVRIMGYVPDLKEILATTLVSVAPLRYGAGMKGKIGEAMGHGVPVVTTSVGIEGFGLAPGKNVLVGDSPHEFCNSVVRLIEDLDLYEKIRHNGHRFIDENYSERAISSRVTELIDNIADIPDSPIPLYRKLIGKTSIWLDEHVLWRFNR